MMLTDTALRSAGMKILSEGLGLVEAERFITLMIREPFDYTVWQRDLFKGLSLEELNTRAVAHWEAKYPNEAEI